MASIPHNPEEPALPRFCSLGVVLRTLVVANALGLLLALGRARSLGAAWGNFVEIAGFLQPVVLASLPLLCALRSWLARLGYRAGLLAVIALELAIVTGVALAGRRILDGSLDLDLPRLWLLTAAFTGLLLYYFDLRGRALSPALAEARLQALQARIRPHFLFNSLNAVLSLIRAEPRRAERALADMADLFRVLMADNRRLTTLAEEIELCRQYLEIEQLRLGERLTVSWHIDKMPGEARIPPLVLQPLVENAVYHGVEPASLSGEIAINAWRAGDQVIIVLKNPYHPEYSHHGGNKMAMANIRERLRLHFDVEASLKAQVLGESYQVTITLPYTTGEAS